MPNDSILRDIKTVRDWAVSEQGWDAGAFDRVMAFAEEVAGLQEWEYGAMDESGRVHVGSRDFSLRSVKGTALPGLISSVRRVRYPKGLWVGFSEEES